MCGALAISSPSASNTAHEKSSRSLTLTEWAVACSRTPICSATDMNRLLKISSITGSTAVPAAARPGLASTRVSSRSPRPVSSARQPGSTTVVAKSSTISAGPATRSPVRRSRRRASRARVHPPPEYSKTDASPPPSCPGRGGCPGGPPAGSARTGAASGAEGAASSTDTASAMIALSRMRKEKNCRYDCSKSASIWGSGPSGTGSAVSVPSYRRWARRT